jgi:cytoplasmic iron level regulating protein YaaA (DUF328/UPF0246 family)
MKMVVLISCVSKKLDCLANAKDLYVSQLFKYNMKYAEQLMPNKIFILSAKHGLLNLDDEIEPYDVTLNMMPSKEIKQWSEQVLESLRKEIDIERDEVVFLAGEKYRKYLLPKIKNYSIPLEGLPIGKQLQFLKGAIK